MTPDERSTRRKVMSEKVLLSIFGALFYFLLSACSAESDSIKNEILGALPNAKNKTVAVDLKKFSKQKITNICIQTPYLSRKIFENRLGKKIENFSEVGDEFFILWIFYDEVSPVQVKFNRWSEINFTEPIVLPCVSSSGIYLSNSHLSLNPN